MTTSLFDRVAGLVEEIGVEKQAAATEKQAETGIPDPGGAEGATSHPSKKTDDDLQPASEGFQSADNERIVKDQIPDTVNAKPDVTPEGAPKATDVQQGQGVDKAKPTGEDSSTEEDYKGKLEGDKREGDQGGTTHPATGDYGEKYSADVIGAMSDEDLLKSAADLGNELTADLANGHFSPETPATNNTGTTTKEAAEAGQTTAAQAGNLGTELDKIASDVVQELVKSAYHQADLVSDHLAKKLSLLQKEAEGEAEDPTSGVGEGEDHGTEEGPSEGAAPLGGEEAPPEGANELLAAMGGGGEMGGEMGGMPPEAGGMGGAPEEMGGVPEEMGGMGDEAALQQLAMALLEMGIDPAQLAALAAPEGQKIASAVQAHKSSGRFQFEEAKEGSDSRKVRDYMKGFVSELLARSRN